MILVIDTNCLLVSLPRHSETRWRFDAIRAGKFEFAITTEILEEYEEVIGSFYAPSVATNVVELFRTARNCIWTTTHYRWNLISDQDDNKFVDCTIGCQADYIITHDRHFNVLKEIHFPKVKVLRIPELKTMLGL